MCKKKLRLLGAQELSNEARGAMIGIIIIIQDSTLVKTQEPPRMKRAIWLMLQANYDNEVGLYTIQTPKALHFLEQIQCFLKNWRRCCL